MFTAKYIKYSKLYENMRLCKTYQSRSKGNVLVLLLLTNCMSVLERSAGMALKGLS